MTDIQGASNSGTFDRPHPVVLELVGVVSFEVRLPGTGDLRVTGDSVLDGKVNIGGNLTVEGKVELAGELEVDGKVTANSSLYVKSGGI